MKLKVGDIFDTKYEIEEILGSGGVGIVYKAKQLKVRRKVALKVLHLQSAIDDEYRARFLREAQTLNKLSHQNIVTVYNLAETPDSIPYLAMEYINGESLKQVINSLHRMPVLRSLKIIRDAANAMFYVHQSGIIHRDLKPDNILLVNQPVADTVKIVDFGFAGLQKPQDSNNEDPQKITKTGEIMGTATYMSPEQCLGRAVSFRSDIYSLTTCLYLMIVGREPFEADTPIGLMYKHINEPVPAIQPNQTDVFDPSLNEIFRIGMAKNPDDRFVSMEEMANKIEQCISQFGPQQKNRAPLALLLSVLAVLALCASAVLLRKEESATPYITNRASKYRQFAPFDEQREEKPHTPNNIDPRRLLRPSFILAESDLSKGFYRQVESNYKTSLRLAKSVPKSENVQVDLLKGLAESSCLQRRFVEAEATYETALAMARNIPGYPPVDLHNTIDQIAYCQSKQGKFSKPESVDKVISTLLSDLKVARSGQYVANTVAGLIYWARCCNEEARSGEEQKLLKAALLIAQNDDISANQCVSPYILDIGDAYFSDGDYEKAEEVYRQFVANAKRRKEPISQKLTYDCLNSLAKCYQKEGRYKLAEDLLQKLTAPGEGISDFYLAPSFVTLADCYMEEGKLTMAEKLYKRSFDIPSERTGRCILSLAECYVKQGKYDEAENIAKPQTKWEKSDRDLNDPYLYSFLMLHGNCLMSKKKYAEAEPLFQRAVTVETKKQKDAALFYLAPAKSHLPDAMQSLEACRKKQGKSTNSKPVSLKT